MKLWIMSDLHQEFSTLKWKPETIPDHDALILIGDIDCGVENAAKYAQELSDKPIIQICGNHEFYGYDIDIELKKLNRLTQAKKNYHFVENKVVFIGNVRFICASLWTDFKYFGEDFRDAAMQLSERGMNDYSRISRKGKKFRPIDALKMHEESLAFLEKSLEDHFDGKTLVVTHHAPHKGSVLPLYATDTMTSAFVSNLEVFIKKHQPDFWLHGHVHAPFSYTVGKTQIICNPRGYKDENHSFNANLVIDV